MKGKFEDQLIKYDLTVLFEPVKDASDILKRIEDGAPKIFGDYLTKLPRSGTTWIEELWKKGKEYGYQFNEPSNVLGTAIEHTEPVLKAELERAKSQKVQTDLVKYFFSPKSGHWGSSRWGKGVKLILDSPLPGKHVDNIDNIETIETNLRNFIVRVAEFDPLQEDASEFFSKEPSGRYDKSVTVLYHMVWPQYFPVFWVTTKSGYSQVAGMKLLLDALSDDCLPKEVKLKGLNLAGNYRHYSAAYRALLYGYDKALKKNTPPHWDYFTEFLAEIDIKADAEQLLRRKKAIILFGVPGTGKTYFALELAKKISGEKNISRIQFHPNYSYQDFVIGIRPTSEGPHVTYPVVPGKFYEVCREAADPQKKDNKFCLVIDEINRADVSKVFGELMYCLEYRGPKDGKLQLPLVVSDGSKTDHDPFEEGREFYVPENLYIIGTMNTVDKSVTGFDIALRRRFGWFKLEYDEIELQKIVEWKLRKESPIITNIEGFCRKATKLNDDIEKKLDLTPEHRIGHTYFAEIVEIVLNDSAPGGGDIGIKSKHLKQLWMYHLEPLLEEYLGYNYQNANVKDELAKLRSEFVRILE